MTSLVAGHNAIDLLQQMENGGALTPTSLVLTDPGLSFDRYEAIGRWLGTLRDATAWWLGDWLIFGEGVYGEKYAQAVEATGRSKQTLKNYLWVAQAIPSSRRRDGLSWSHHETIASLEPEQQKRLLDLADRECLSVEEFRGRVREVRGLPEPPRATKSDLAWAAGFIEGEGTIDRNGSTPRLKATNTDREPLERLVRTLGGYINGPYSRDGNRKPHFVWQVHGEEAKVAVGLLSPWLSVRRLDRAREWEVLPVADVVEIDADEAAEIAEALSSTAATPRREELYAKIREAAAANGAVTIHVTDGPACPTCGRPGYSGEEN